MAAAAAGHDVVRLLLEQTGPQLTRTYQRYSAQLASLPVDAKARVVRSLFLKSNGFAVEGGPVPGFSVTDIGGTWTGGPAYTPSLPSSRARRPPSPAAAQYLVPAPGDPPAAVSAAAAPTPGRRGAGMPDAELTVIANILLSTYGAELTLLKHLIDGASPVTGEVTAGPASAAVSGGRQGASDLGATAGGAGGGSRSGAATPGQMPSTPTGPPAAPSSVPDFNLLDVVDAVGDTTRHHLLSHFRQQGLVALAEFNTAALLGRFVAAGLAALAPLEAAVALAGGGEGSDSVAPQMSTSEHSSAAQSETSVLSSCTRAALASARVALASAPASLWWPVRMYSDFDDTIAAKLFDTSFPGGTAYPGVVALYNAITRGSLPPPLPPPELLAAASAVLAALAEVGLLAKPAQHYEVHGNSVSAHSGWRAGDATSAAAAAAADLDASDGLLRSSVAAFVEAGEARRARQGEVTASPAAALSPGRLPPALSAAWPAHERASPLPGRVVLTPVTHRPTHADPPSPGFNEPSLDTSHSLAEPAEGASVASFGSEPLPSTPSRPPLPSSAFTPLTAGPGGEGSGTPAPPAPPPTPFRAAWYNGINPSGLVFISARPSFLRANTVRAARAVGLDPVTVLCGTVASAWSRAAMARRKRDNYRRYHEALFPEYRSIWVGDAGQGDIRFGLTLLDETGHHHPAQQQQHAHRHTPQHALGTPAAAALPRDAGAAGHSMPVALAPATPASPGVVRRRSARDALQAAAKGWWSRHVTSRTSGTSPSVSGGAGSSSGVSHTQGAGDPWGLDLVAFVAASLDPAATSKATAAAALSHGAGCGPYSSTSPFAASLCLTLRPPSPLVLIHDIVTSKGLPYSAAYEGSSSSGGEGGEGVPRSKTEPLPVRTPAALKSSGGSASHRTGIAAAPELAAPPVQAAGAGGPAFPPSLAPGVRASLAARGVHVFDSYLDAAVVCAAAGGDAPAPGLSPAPLLTRSGLEEVLASATAEFSRVLPGLDTGRRADRIAELQAAVGAALGLLSGPDQANQAQEQGLRADPLTTPPPPPPRRR